ncbi:hypothetical protein MAFF301560_29920 [Ralstonia solanacearum]|uniref:Type II toxin-antitoxin system HigB family toxin n=3 Tax=Ralstonia solanacearum species complex TaxID=3116862 RepID=A0A0S4V4N7_RALSL|nr:hypothetical protein MAFF301560_29920 [Ralstonia solanacearum]BEU45644.1 hypothetical protein MAFF211519_09690 [Ralstonia pseudosolanacearum]CUV29667.1 conserved protein of unknown function [Ralstonia solanacearum]
MPPLRESQNGTTHALMRIVAKKNLPAFCAKHPGAKPSRLAWHAEAARATWKTPQDIKAHYASASFVGRNRVVFNIGGNNYRLIAAIAFQIGVVHVKFVGTHAEHGRIDAATVELESGNGHPTAAYRKRLQRGARHRFGARRCGSCARHAGR